MDKVRLLVINKIDDVYDEIAYAAMRREPYAIVETSMKDGIGIDALLLAMAKATDEEYMDITVTDTASSDIISRLSRDATIRSIDYGDDTVTVTARISRKLAGKYTR